MYFPFEGKYEYMYATRVIQKLCSQDFDFFFDPLPTFTFICTARPQDTRVLVPEKKLKTALCEVYTYVLSGIVFQKTVYLQGFGPKSAYVKVTVM